MTENPTTPASSGLRRWFGPAGFISVGLLLAGRIAVESVRLAPHFESDSMEPHAAVETFRLRKDPRTIKTAIFGSSVTIWGVIPEIIAEETHTDPAGVRKLAVQGGTAFDMWKLVQNNPDKFQKVRVALIEIGPRLLDEDNETGRVALTISQHAFLPERLLLKQPSARAEQVWDYVLGFDSARRSLRTSFLNVVKPHPGWAVYPEPDDRIHPHGHWELTGPRHFRPKVTAEKAARILVNDWKASRLHDGSFRKLLAWFRERNAEIILYQMPVHPDVVECILNDKDYAEGYASYRSYIESLGVAPNHMIRPLIATECGISEDGMKDHTHLNQAGATTYSHFLGKEVQLILKPPDHPSKHRPRLSGTPTSNSRKR